MRHILLIAVLLTGCTKANSNYLVEQTGADMDTQPSNLPDMAGQIVGDMATQPDMVTHTGPDMAQTSNDMAPVQSADMTPPVADMAEVPDMTHGPADMSNGYYTHNDTFCQNTWIDANPTVNPQLSTTAAYACAACCATVTGSACTCTDNSHVSVGGYVGTVSFMSFTSGTYKYWFYYYDSNAQLKAGKGEQYLTGIGLTNTAHWDQ